MFDGSAAHHSWYSQRRRGRSSGYTVRKKLVERYITKQLSFACGIKKSKDAFRDDTLP
ncbi:MAG: hypothetical protein IT292_09460 [Deltaproteobacteria bacterium]|nr:hypothetical protein [Deltaproteobacteria bacterium]